MMNKKDILEQAIIGNDISVIEEYYSLVYDCDPPTRGSVGSVTSVGELKKVFDSCLDLMLEMQDLVYGNVDEYEEVEKEDDGASSPVATNSFEVEDLTKGETKFISSNEFSFPEFDNDEYKKSLEKHSKKSKNKEKRNPYQKNVQKCEGCGAEFDFNKEYPAGRLESSSKIKCNKCRASGA